MLAAHFIYDKRSTVFTDELHIVLRVFWKVSPISSLMFCLRNYFSVLDLHCNCLILLRFDSNRELEYELTQLQFEIYIGM